MSQSSQDEQQDQEQTKLSDMVPKEAEDFLTLDQKDEDQMVMEFKGETLNDYIYEFKSGGKKVIGLSYAGVKAVIHNMRGVNVQLCKFKETDHNFQVICLAHDKVRDIIMYGAAQQKKIMTGRNAGTDNFALAKCVSKAQRNALRNLIPEALIAKLVTAYLNKGEQPTTTDIAESLKNQAKEAQFEDVE